MSSRACTARTSTPALGKFSPCMPWMTFADRLMKFSENVIQGMHGENFPNAGVVIENVSLSIARSVVIAHPDVRAANKGRIAEDHPGLLRSSEEAFPENTKGYWRLCACVSRTGFSGPARKEPIRGDRHDGGESDDESNYGCEPPTGGPGLTG